MTAIHPVQAVKLHTAQAAVPVIQTAGGAAPTVHGTATRHGAGAAVIRGIQALPTGAATGKKEREKIWKQKKKRLLYFPHSATS